MVVVGRQDAAPMPAFDKGGKEGVVPGRRISIHIVNVYIEYAIFEGIGASRLGQT